MRSDLDVADLLAETTDGARLDQLRAQGLADLRGLEWVMEQAQDLVHDDPKAAEDLGRLCGLAAAQLDLPPVAAQVCYLQARIITERGDLEGGLRLIGQARQEWLRAGRPVAALRTDLGRMQILDDLGRHADALAVGESLLTATAAIAAEEPERELALAVRAHAIDNMGAAYGFTGQHERALAAYAEAGVEYQRLGLTAEAARPRANRGIELLALGRARDALGDLSAATAAFAAAGDRMFAAKCQGHLAQAHQQLGEVVEALAVLEDARATLVELGATVEASRLRLAIADTYLAIGLWPEAEHEAAVAAEALHQAGMTHDAAVADFIQAEAALGAAEPERAERDLARAETAFRTVGDRQFSARVGLAASELAALRGQEAQARSLAAEAVDQLRTGGWLPSLASAHLRLADLAREDHDAEQQLAEAGELIASLRLPHLVFQHRLRLARLARRRGDNDQAETLLVSAIADLGRSAGALPDHAMRTAFRADRLAAYDELVVLLLDRDGRDDGDRARRLADESKATTLRDLRAEAVGTWSPAGPARLGTGRCPRRSGRHLPCVAAGRSPRPSDLPARPRGSARRSGQRASAAAEPGRVGRRAPHRGVDLRPGGSPEDRRRAAWRRPGGVPRRRRGGHRVRAGGSGGPRTPDAGGRAQGAAETGRPSDQWTRFQLGTVFQEAAPAHAAAYHPGPARPTLRPHPASADPADRAARARPAAGRPAPASRAGAVPRPVRRRRLPDRPFRDHRHPDRHR